MPKKRKARKNGALPLLPLLLGAAAVVAGCALLSPRHGHAPVEAPVLQPTATVTVTPLQSAPAATISASPSLAPASPVGRSSASQEAKLAIIIDDCGQWISTERGFVALPIPVTMSVLPDVPYTSTIQREAVDAGKGVMLHLPMETVSGLNPGPGKVTTEMSDEAIQSQVKSDLAQVPLAQGVNNHEGSKASADTRVMRDVAQTLVQHGDLFFIDSRTASNSVAEQVAADAGLPTAGRDVFLDNQETVAYTEAQLREAAAIAKRTGSAIAIGHPRPTTLEAVRAMIPELQSEGITFVLVRNLAVRRGAR